MKATTTFALTLLLNAVDAIKLELEDIDIFNRTGHSMVCLFSSKYDDEGTRFTQGIDNAFDSLYLGPTDSNNFIVWDKVGIPTGFECEGLGMTYGGDLKYILTQEDPVDESSPGNEWRSWLISEEAKVEREFGLDVVAGTKFTISFIKEETVAVAYGSDGCDDNDEN